MIRINVEKAGLRASIEYLNAAEPKAKRAAIRATNKTLKWLTGQMAKEVAGANKIPLRSLKKVRAFTAKATKGNPKGVAWLGINPVGAGYFSPLRAKGTGAKAGKHFIEGGFIATAASGHRMVLKRTGKGRYPVEYQKVSLGTSGDYSNFEAMANTRLETILAQELNYEFNVKGKT